LIVNRYGTIIPRIVFFQNFPSEQTAHALYLGGREPPPAIEIADRADKSPCVKSSDGPRVRADRFSECLGGERLVGHKTSQSSPGQIFQN
jgi:hypothetical protein